MTNTITNERRKKFSKLIIYIDDVIKAKTDKQRSTQLLALAYEGMEVLAHGAADSYVIMERASWVHQQVMTGQSSFQVACAEAEASL
jgi:hypothetical protein